MATTFRYEIFREKRLKYERSVRIRGLRYVFQSFFEFFQMAMIGSLLIYSIAFQDVLATEIESNLLDRKI